MSWNLGHLALEGLVSRGEITIVAGLDGYIRNLCPAMSSVPYSILLICMMPGQMNPYTGESGYIKMIKINSMCVC